MRIVYLNPCGQLGGAELSLLDMLGSIRSAEPTYELHLVLGEDGPLLQKAQQFGVRVYLADFPRALARWGDSIYHPLPIAAHAMRATNGTARYVLRLRRLLKAIDPHVIHTNGFKMHVLGIWARSRNTPVIWHIRDFVSSRRAMKPLLAFHAGRCAAAIGNSESVAQDIQRVCGSRLQTACVYNAIDLEQYSTNGPKADLDRLSNLPLAEPGIVRIGMVATLASWKGHTVFLRALAHLPEHLRYRAYLVGGPIYQTEKSQRTLTELRALAAELGIADRVGFTGFVSTPADVMRSLDIVVHASTKPEPFGRVIAEGMACGRAVICSATGGAAELVREGEDALTHEPGDHMVLASRISELAQDSELRARLGLRARTTAERRFDSKRLAREIVPLYQRIRSDSTTSSPAQWAAAR